MRLFVGSHVASIGHREVSASHSHAGEYYLHRAPSKNLYGSSRHEMRPRPITCGVFGRARGTGPRRKQPRTNLRRVAASDLGRPPRPRDRLPIPLALELGRTRRPVGMDTPSRWCRRGVDGHRIRRIPRVEAPYGPPGVDPYSDSRGRKPRENGHVPAHRGRPPREWTPGRREDDRKDAGPHRRIRK